VYSDLNRPPLQITPLSRALVRPGGFWTELRLAQRTGSTNADVAAAARDGAPEGLVVVAEEQDDGRGRLGRSWVSPPRAGLTFSVLLRPAGVPAQRRGWLPLLAGVGLARAVGQIAELDAVLKWPNDLLLGPARRKAAGLLAEVAGDAVVLGIGLNVTTRAAELPVADATSLALEHAACTDRDILLRAVLRALADDYQVWLDAAGDPEASGLRRAYVESCDTIGREVRVELPGREVVVGKAIDIDTDGRLVVDPSEGGQPVPIAAGDVVYAHPVRDA
jgi:BirA family transcriptional regulator, biotin operon repressor / biotin---[acetyl-CoA-carboxylase] ligase